MKNSILFSLKQKIQNIAMFAHLVAFFTNKMNSIVYVKCALFDWHWHPDQRHVPIDRITSICVPAQTATQVLLVCVERTTSIETGDILLFFVSLVLLLNWCELAVIHNCRQQFEPQFWWTLVYFCLPFNECVQTDTHNTMLNWRCVPFINCHHCGTSACKHKIFNWVFGRNTFECYLLY